MKRLDLNGTWKLRWSDGQRGRPHFAEQPDADEARYIDATVPGEVHLDLMKAGLIKDPAVEAQAKEARWVEDCIWSYRRHLDIPEEAVRGRAWLCFQVLDLAATIVLNGEKIGTHQNVFYPCRIEVTEKLKPGRNLLTVHVECGLFAVSEKPHTGYRLQGIDQELHKRHWLRKPQSQFSWDWSPRLINTGISGNVWLEWTEAPVRLDEFVALVDVSPDLERGCVNGRFFLERLAPEGGEAIIALVLEEENIRQEVQVTLRAGVERYEVTLEVPSPRLWWPTGHGAPELYTLHAELIVDDVIVERQMRRIGFRRVRVNQDPHPESGRYFIFEINNRPIFLKGANLIPADIIFARLDRPRYEALVGRAQEANFNFLRVWGGGVYESEDFYDLCDERGIVVWQEFIYACGKYPLHDEAFFVDARREAIFQIRRLAHRPSLIAWCGNNEIDMFDSSPISERGMVHTDYAFFHSTLPRLMREEDPARYFQPSSPGSPDNLPANQDDIGDQHPWSIGFHNIDFYQYRPMICRFPNEGGFLGPTTLPSMTACLPKSQQFIGSHAWQFHDNSVDSWSEPSPVDNILKEWLGRDIRQMTLEEFAYWGGLLQGEALREYIESFRRKMFSSSAACFWMFNDCWPASRSWTIVDWAMRRTPSFHPVRRAFSPISIVLACEDTEIRIYGINESQEPIAATLEYGVFTLEGKYPLRRGETVTLPSNASVVLAAFPSALMTVDAAAFAVLNSREGVLARNRLFLRKFLEMKFPHTEIQIKLQDGMAHFSSDQFVWGVCLDLDGEAPISDNFFDLYPDMEHAIPWAHREAPRILHIGNAIRNEAQ